MPALAARVRPATAPRSTCMFYTLNIRPHLGCCCLQSHATGVPRQEHSNLHRAPEACPMASGASKRLEGRSAAPRTCLLPGSACNTRIRGATACCRRCRLRLARAFARCACPPRAEAQRLTPTACSARRLRALPLAPRAACRTSVWRRHAQRFTATKRRRIMQPPSAAQCCAERRCHRGAKLRRTMPTADAAAATGH